MDRILTKEEFWKLKPGSKLQLKQGRGLNWNPGGAMDQYSGSVVVFREFTPRGFFHIEQDDRRSWFFNREDIAYEIKDGTEEEEWVEF